MTVKRLFLHIGMQKTGTTSIQQYFTDNEQALLRLHGLYYLRGYNHRCRCNAIFPLTQEGIDFLREKHREAAQTGYSDILISDETTMKGGHGPFIDTLPILRDIFPGHEVRIILYLRRADDWCKSYYAERLKKTNDKKHSMRTFAAHCNSRWGLEKGLFSLPGTIRALAGAVGRENCILRHYDRKSMKNGDALHDFADIFGINIPLGIPEEKFSGNRNPSLPVEALPYLAPLADNASPLPSDFRNHLIPLIRTSFERSVDFHAKTPDAAKIKRSIDELDALLPGYKESYQEREFSLDWPELEVNPALVAMSELLYHIAHRVNLLQEQQQELLGAMRSLLETHISQIQMLTQTQAELKQQRQVLEQLTKSADLRSTLTAKGEGQY